MLDKTTVKRIATQYADEVKKALNPKAVILFGSYVNGTPHESSDIDIAVILDGFEGDWLKASSLLFRLRRGVSIDIEPHLFDERDDRSEFVEHVFRTGEVIYAA